MTDSAASSAAQASTFWSRLTPLSEKILPLTLDRHVIAALIMVAISVLGAVAAYRVALAEQRSVSLERRLAAGQLQDISYRQQLLAEVLVRIGHSNLQSTLNNEAVGLRAAYKAFANTDASVSNWLEWHAAELQARRNAMRHFTTFLRDLTNDKMSIEQQLATRSARELRNQGFFAIVDMDPKAETALRFPRLEEAIEKAHKLGPALSFCVLLFVFGLVCLTVAELDLGPRPTWVALAAAGSLTAIAATIAVMVIDPGAAWSIVPLSIVLLIAVVMAARNGLFLKSHDPQHTPHPEAPEPAKVSFAHLSGRPSHDNWSRTIVGMIALTVFISALFGWFYSTSLKHAGEFGLEAQETRIELVNRRTRLSAVTMGGAFDAAIGLLNARVRCAAASQLAAMVDDGIVTLDRVRVATDRKQRCDELDELSKRDAGAREALDADDLADSGQSPAQRMNDIIMNREGGPQELFARADGLAEASAGWGTRASLLLAVLTILAITLYLFGQAYTMGRTTAGRWLIGSGIVMLCASFGVGVYAWSKPVIAPMDAALPSSCAEKGITADTVEDVVKWAAVKYAAGVRSFDLASTSVAGSPQRAEADQAAADAFKCVTMIRPGFTSSFQKYERAIARLNSPQREERYSSLNSKTRLTDLHDVQLRELRAYVQAGMLRPRGLLGNFAFDSTELALTENRPDALADARTVLDLITGQASWWQRQYVQLMRPELWSEEPPSNDTVDWLNLGLAQLATGEPDQIQAAERTYAKALKLEAGWSPALLASALTDLEILRAYCGNLYRDGDTCARISAAIENTRPLIAAGAGRADLPAASTAAASGFAAHVTPYSVSWEARIHNFDAKRDRLTVAWFRDDTPVDAKPDPSQWQLRRALPDIFDIYHPGSDDKLPDHDETGVTYRTISYAYKADSCLAAGRYIAELFLNGTRVASIALKLDSHDLKIYRSRELDLAWCIPSSWQSWNSDKKTHPWLADRPARGFTYQKPDGALGFGGAIMAFYVPPSLLGPERKQYFLHRAVQILLSKGRRNADGTPSRWSLADENHFVGTAMDLAETGVFECKSDKSSGHLTYRFLPNAADKYIVQIALVDGHLTGKNACTILKSLTNYFF